MTREEFDRKAIDFADYIRSTANMPNLADSRKIMCMVNELRFAKIDGINDIESQTRL